MNNVQKLETYTGDREMSKIMMDQVKKEERLYDLDKKISGSKTKDALMLAALGAGTLAMTVDYFLKLSKHMG